jgi:hypothetical protein
MGAVGLAPSCHAFAAHAKFVSVHSRRFQCVDNALASFTWIASEQHAKNSAQGKAPELFLLQFVDPRDQFERLLERHPQI